MTATEAREEVRAKLSVQRRQVLERQWSGRTGATDRDVLAALMGWMIKCGSDQVNYSVRNAMLDTGKADRNTAARSLIRLAEDGWIRRTRPKKRGDAALYKSLVGQRLKEDGETSRRKVATEANPAAETWVRLRGRARDVYECLTHEPQSGASIAKAANVDKGTASRNLRKLAASDLARKEDRGWVVGRLSPDEAAEANTWVEENSKALTRKAQVERERERFREDEGKRDAAVKQVVDSRAARQAARGEEMPLTSDPVGVA